MTVDKYYKSLKSPQREICSELRKLINETYPKLKESMLWGVPVFNEGLFYIVSLKDHVNLGFTISNLSKEEEKLFDGGGKTTRKIEFRTVEDIEKPKIIALLDFVYKRNR